MDGSEHRIDLKQRKRVKMAMWVIVTQVRSAVRRFLAYREPVNRFREDIYGTPIDLARLVQVYRSESTMANKIIGIDLGTTNSVVGRN